MTIEETGVATSAPETSSAPESAPSAPESSGSPESSSVESSGSPEGDSSSVGPAGPVGPAYTPNYKFKYAVAGKNTAEEREFDEDLRPLIKNAETEKKYRDLYEKAYGLDFVKPRYQEQRQELQTLRTEHEGLNKELQTLGQHVQKKDIGTVAAMLGLSKEDVYNWVRSDLQYQELPQEERQRIEHQKQLEQRAQMGDQRFSQLQQQYESTQVQFRTMQLDSAMSQPTIAPVQQAVDAKLGAGAFKSEVILLGQQVYQATGRDISVEEATQFVTKKYAPFIGSAPAAETVIAPGESDPRAPKKVPVIPHVSGRSTSPAKKVATSLDDIKKRQRELAAEMTE